MSQVLFCENSSVGRAQPCQGWGREFESRFSLIKSLPFRGAFFVVGQGFPRVGNVGSLAGETAVDSLGILETTN